MKFSSSFVAADRAAELHVVGSLRVREIDLHADSSSDADLAPTVPGVSEKGSGLGMYVTLVASNEAVGREQQLERSGRVCSRARC